jgi:hypothetical protein
MKMAQKKKKLGRETRPRVTYVSMRYLSLFDMYAQICQEISCQIQRFLDATLITDIKALSNTGSTSDFVLE